MTIDDLRCVLIVGAGAIGRQIAVSTACSGFDVVVYDVDANALAAAETECRQRLSQRGSSLKADSALPSGANGALSFSSNAADAAGRADLLIECVPERLPLKRDVFREFARLCPPHTIFATNTSVLLPSMLIAASGRPEKLAALHFIMESAMTELMPHQRTSAETVAILEQFSRRIGHLPFLCRREHPGYLVNTLLMAMNNAALTLVANGVADFKDVDRAWMKASHSPRGPFGWLDLVGLDTALEITEFGARATGRAEIQKNASLLKQYVERGLLGLKNGRGFYSYPNPEYESLEFLSNTAS